MTTRRQRGNDTGNLTAAYLRTHGFPHAEHVGAGRPGTDITGTPGIVWEIRARAQFDPLKTMRDAARHATNGALPIGIIRPNGSGPAHLTEWLAILRLADLVTLTRQAGYGDQ